jgi:hypothetical protein
MPPRTQSEALSVASRFHGSALSLFKFDNIEVHGVITTLLLKTDEDNCFVGTYYRARANIETMIGITDAKHFQALAMLARAIFELAVDIRLLSVIPDGPEKMVAGVDVEKLRCARKAAAFRAANAGAGVDSQFDLFIQFEAARVDANRKRLWPHKDSTKLTNVTHWSGFELRDRVTNLGAPFETIYNLRYPQLSWYVHSGLTGVVNVDVTALTNVCTLSFKLAADAYWEVLKTIIVRYGIEKANEKIHQKMKVAQLLPFTDDPDQEDALVRSIQ